MGLFIRIIYWIIYLVQYYLGFGTAYRLTKNGGDNGLALFGWFIVMNLASLVPGLGIYLWFKYREESYEKQEDVDNHIRSLNDRIIELENKERTNTMPCPLCGEKIINNSLYCRFCGGNVEENQRLQQVKLQENMQEKFAQYGLGALFDDDRTMSEVKHYQRLYGKRAGISYLKGKARELGFGDIEISEEDLDSLL